MRKEKKSEYISGSVPMTSGSGFGRPKKHADPVDPDPQTLHQGVIKTCLIFQGSQEEVNRLLADMAARESEMSRTVQQTEQQTKLIRELQE
jgi:hypothetical protein